MTEHGSPALILFSGMAADATVLAPQKLAFPELIVPDWPVPAVDDTLATYCERFATSIRPARPCVIGGASFGGIIALEMARYLQPLAVLLIGSVRTPSDLPRRVRMFRPVRAAVSLLPLGLLQWCAAPLATQSARRLTPQLGGVAGQFRSANRSVLRWSIRQLLTWSEAPVVECPVYRIHGDRDHLLPMRGTQPDHPIPGGGHLISLTHAEQVNAFIQDCLNKTACGQSIRTAPFGP